MGRAETRGCLVLRLEMREAWGRRFWLLAGHLLLAGHFLRREFSNRTRTLLTSDFCRRNSIVLSHGCETAPSVARGHTLDWNLHVHVGD